MPVTTRLHGWEPVYVHQTLTSITTAPSTILEETDYELVKDGNNTSVLTQEMTGGKTLDAERH